MEHSIPSLTTTHKKAFCMGVIDLTVSGMAVIGR